MNAEGAELARCCLGVHRTDVMGDFQLAYRCVQAGEHPKGHLRQPGLQANTLLPVVAADHKDEWTQSAPAILAPLNGCWEPNSVRQAISPGISASARSISRRPKSAWLMSLTLYCRHSEILLVIRSPCCCIATLAELRCSDATGDKAWQEKRASQGKRRDATMRYSDAAIWVGRAGQMQSMKEGSTKQHHRRQCRRLAPPAGHVSHSRR